MRVSVGFDVVIATITFGKRLAKNQRFRRDSIFFFRFLRQIAEGHELVHFISILASVCVNIRYILIFF